MQKIVSTGEYKKLWVKEKMLVTSIPCFFQNVIKILLKGVKIGDWVVMDY